MRWQCRLRENIFSLFITACQLSGEGYVFSHVCLFTGGSTPYKVRPQPSPVQNPSPGPATPLYRVPTPPWTNSQYMKYKKVPVQPPDMLKLVQVGPHCTVGKTVGWHSPENAVLFLLLQQVPSPHKSANVTTYTSSQTFLLNFAESFKPRAFSSKRTACDGSAGCMKILTLITARKRSSGKVIF